MNDQAEYVRDQHLKTIQLRLGFTLVFVAFQWLISIRYSMPLHNILGLSVLAICAIALIFSKRSLTTVSREYLCWIIAPVVFAVALQMTVVGQMAEFKGLTIVSSSLFLIIAMPRRNFRFITPILLFASFLVTAEILDHSLFVWPRLVVMLVLDIIIAGFISNHMAKMDEVVFADRYKSALFMKNLVGSSIKKFIAEGSDGKLDGKSANGFLLQFDIRGFSSLVRNSEEEVFISFIRDYYDIVSLAVGRHGGVIHRTAGDSHIVCFGIYNNEDTDRKQLFFKALNCFEEITRETALLPERHGLTEDLKIGGALDYGELKVHIFGHKDHHREVDLLGPVLVRCARLETYTKTILSTMLRPASILILSPNALIYSDQVENFEVHEVGEKPVRDFAHIRWLAYRVFTHRELHPPSYQREESAS
jgi:class 3 adenylate cyclase